MAQESCNVKTQKSRRRQSLWQNPGKMLTAPKYVGDRNNYFKIMLHYFKLNAFPKMAC